MLSLTPNRCNAANLQNEEPLRYFSENEQIYDKGNKTEERQTSGYFNDE